MFDVEHLQICEQDEDVIMLISSSCLDNVMDIVIIYRLLLHLTGGTILTTVWTNSSSVATGWNQETVELYQSTDSCSTSVRFPHNREMISLVSFQSIKTRAPSPCLQILAPGVVWVWLTELTGCFWLKKWDPWGKVVLVILGSGCFCSVASELGENSYVFLGYVCLVKNLAPGQRFSQ